MMMRVSGDECECLNSQLSENENSQCEQHCEKNTDDKSAEKPRITNILSNYDDDDDEGVNNCDESHDHILLPREKVHSDSEIGSAKEEPTELPRGSGLFSIFRRKFTQLNKVLTPPLNSELSEHNRDDRNCERSNYEKSAHKSMISGISSSSDDASVNGDECECLTSQLSENENAQCEQ